MGAYDTLTKLFDEGSFNEVDALLKSKDSKAEAVAGYGTVDGAMVYAFAQNLDECGGAMSEAQSKKILKIYDLALKTGSPVIGFYDSKGGRLEDKSIMNSYGDILNRAACLSGVVPQISVILGTCLGTSALIAASADFIIMKEDAKLSVKTDLESAGSEDNSKKGIAALVCKDDDECISAAKQMISYFPVNNLDEIPVYDGVDAKYTDNLSTAIVDEDSSICLFKEFGGKVGTAFARVGGVSVGIICAFDDKITCQGANKIAKMVRFCDAFSIPLITLVDTSEFECLKGASKVASAYAEATTAKIAVINKKAIGSAYIALCGSGSNSDIVYAIDGAVVSPIAPVAAAFILDADNMNVPKEERENKAMEFVNNNLSAVNAAECGFIDDVVSVDMIRSKVVSALDMLSSKRISTLPKKHSTI